MRQDVYVGMSLYAAKPTTLSFMTSGETIGWTTVTRLVLASCCVRAASGQAAVEPSNPMNSLLLLEDNTSVLLLES